MNIKYEGEATVTLTHDEIHYLMAILDVDLGAQAVADALKGKNMVGVMIAKEQANEASEMAGYARDQMVEYGGSVEACLLKLRAAHAVLPHPLDPPLSAEQLAANKHLN